MHGLVIEIVNAIFQTRASCITYGSGINIIFIARKSRDLNRAEQYPVIVRIAINAAVGVIHYFVLLKIIGRAALIAGLVLSHDDVTHRPKSITVHVQRLRAITVAIKTISLELVRIRVPPQSPVIKTLGDRKQFMSLLVISLYRITCIAAINTVV